MNIADHRLVFQERYWRVIDNIAIGLQLVGLVVGPFLLTGATAGEQEFKNILEFKNIWDNTSENRFIKNTCKGFSKWLSSYFIWNG